MISPMVWCQSESKNEKIKGVLKIRQQESKTANDVKNVTWLSIMFNWLFLGGVSALNKGNTFFVQIFWKKKNVELFFC